MEKGRAPYMTRSEFCRRVGITQETLRHYVDRGLIHPAKHTQNHYQLYSLADAAVVFGIRELRSLNLSLDDIEEEMQHIGTQGFEHSVLERERQLLMRQREIERELAQIRYQRSVSDACRTPEGRKPKLSHYSPSISAYYDGTPRGAQQVRELADRFPYSYGVLKFPLNPEKGDLPYQLGMLLPEHALSQEDQLDLAQYEKCPPVRIVACFDIPDLSRASADDFMSVVRYAKKHNYQIIGDIVVVVHHVYRVGEMIGGVVTAGVGVEDTD